MVSSKRAPKNDQRRPQPLLFGAVLAVASLTLVASGSAIAQDVRSAFSGKTSNMIVGMPPGGGADAYARLVQRHLAAHLPGSAAIAAENVPGAGSLKSLLYLNALPADGTAIGTFSSGLLTEAITSPGRVRIDFRRYAWIGNALTCAPAMCGTGRGCAPGRICWRAAK